GRKADKVVIIMEKPSKEELKQKLSDIEYAVTQENATERPYTGKYDDFYQDGIYVDVVSGEPLFSSTDKYDAGGGWPSFTQPREARGVKAKARFSLGMHGEDVRREAADSDRAHVLNEGPEDEVGLRYCRNAAALRFNPVEELEQRGYSEYGALFGK